MYQGIYNFFKNNIWIFVGMGQPIFEKNIVSYNKMTTN